MDTIEHNRDAWNREALEGGPWSLPVDEGAIARARSGDWSVILTPTIPVPRTWFGDLEGAEVLCLASAGGQQVPVLAAAGARVTSYDLSDEQLALDRAVADREGLPLRCVRGNMQDLSGFADASFDLVFHPVSNLFVPDIAPVWAHCARVLRPGGRALIGFANPVWLQFDHDAEEDEQLRLRYPQPYAEPGSLDAAGRAAWEARRTQAVFGHRMQDQVGGLIDAGFALHGFYEDMWSPDLMAVNRFLPAAFAMLGVRAA